MNPLQPRLRHHAWGSRYELARLTGRPRPTDEPEAEMWLGAHPDDPSAVLRPDGTSTPLDRLIRTDPARTLGKVHTGTFGDTLSYLLKVLAIESTLSIQCHPTTAQVTSAPSGTYVDDWGKPEAIVALTDVEAFAGTRPFPQIVATFEHLLSLIHI